MSIALMALALAGLFHLNSSKLNRSEKFVSLLFLLFYLSSVLSALYSENNDEAIRKLVLKLPLLCFPLLYIAFGKLNAFHKGRAILALLYAMYLPAVVSVYNYLSNKQLFDMLILESKPLPVEFGYGIYHIQFSILLASSVLFGIYIILNKTRFIQSKPELILAVILSISNFIFLHILSARTGLLALYSGMAVFAFLNIKNSSKKSIRTGLLLALLFPIIMYFLSSSLRNRISNTISDLKVVWQGSDANDYSFALRVQAWKNAVQVIEKNPVLGVGIGDAETVLKDNFAAMNPSITPENRKNPHFQFLETSVQSGLISGLIFLGLIVSLLFYRKKEKTILPALTLLFFIASCFESILERQASVIGFCLLLSLAMAFENETEKVH